MPEIPLDTDRHLLDRIGHGSTDALASLYDRHAAMVFRLARILDSRDAEAVVIAVFTDVWRDASIPPDRSVSRWLIRLARLAVLAEAQANRHTAARAEYWHNQP